MQTNTDYCRVTVGAYIWASHRTMTDAIAYLDPFQSLSDAKALAIANADIGTHGSILDVGFVLGGPGFGADVDRAISRIELTFGYCGLGIA